MAWWIFSPASILILSWSARPESFLQLQHKDRWTFDLYYDTFYLRWVFRKMSGRTRDEDCTKGGVPRCPCPASRPPPPSSPADWPPPSDSRRRGPFYPGTKLCRLSSFHWKRSSLSKLWGIHWLIMLGWNMSKPEKITNYLLLLSILESWMLK